MKTISYVAIAASLLVAAPAMAESEHLSSADQHFLKEAAMGNLGEVHLGDLAANKGSTPAVREFGRWMMSAHSFANRELTTITERMHGEAPPMKLEAEAEQTMKKLEGLKGDKFDQAYLDAMIEDHKKDLKAFEKEGSEGRDYLVKSFAKNMTPAIREHLAEAEALKADMSNQGRSGAEMKADKDAIRGGMTGPMKSDNGK